MQKISPILIMYQNGRRFSLSPSYQRLLFSIVRNVISVSKGMFLMSSFSYQHYNQCLSMSSFSYQHMDGKQKGAGVLFHQIIISSDSFVKVMFLSCIDFIGFISPNRHMNIMMPCVLNEDCIRFISPYHHDAMCAQ